MTEKTEKVNERQIDFLKPCPFCGNENLKMEKARWFTDILWRIRCKSCGVGTAWSASKKTTIDYWNTRVKE